MSNCPANLRQSVPLLLQRHSQFLQCIGLTLTLMETSPDHVPDMFYGRKIRTHGWPRHTDNMVMLEVFIHDTNPVGTGIIILKDETSMPGMAC